MGTIFACLLAEAQSSVRSLLLAFAIVLAFLSATEAATLPYAFTEPATSFTGKTAVLNGMVTPNGTAATAWFEWGTTTNYGNRTASLNAGNGNSVVFLTNAISGLAIRQSYHYRLVASNDAGVVYGADAQIACGKAIVTWGEWGRTNVPPGLTDIVAVAAGSYHAVVLKNDGTVGTWSTCNDYTNMPLGLSNVVAIAAGGGHSLALMRDGNVVGWGKSDDGAASIPMYVPAWLSDVAAIAAGLDYNLALKKNGQVVAWGDNTYGQTNVPPNLSNVVAIAAGRSHSLALKDDGTVVAWGQYIDWSGTVSSYVPFGLSNVVGIAGGTCCSLALQENGEVVAWGENIFGQTDVPAGATNVVAISCGDTHCIALRRNGTLLAWGSKLEKQSDVSWMINFEMPTNVPMGLTNVIGITAEGWNNLAIVGEAAPICFPATVVWTNESDLVLTLTATDYDRDALSFRITRLPEFGMGILYQYNAGGRGAAILNVDTVVADSLGRVVFVPAASGRSTSGCTFQFSASDGELESAPATISIAHAPPFAITLTPTVTDSSAMLIGTVRPNGAATRVWFEWGSDLCYGNVTASTEVDGNATLRITNLVSGFHTSEMHHCRIVASNAFGVAFGADTRVDQQIGSGKRVVAWGENDYGQANVPSGLSNVVAVAGGANYSLALGTDGTVAAWGDNRFGQTTVPPGLSNTVAIAAGGCQSVALKDDGTVTAWGAEAVWNEDGQVQLDVPDNLSNVVAIAVGGYFTMALKSDGTVAAWGDNSSGQTNVPVGLSNVVAIAAGASHCLALKKGGTVVAWGSNWNGETAVPAGLSNVVMVAAGGFSTALKNDGTVVLWGHDKYIPPTAPDGLSNVVAIAAGGSHCLAFRNDGTVQAWKIWQSWETGYDYGQSDVPTGLNDVVGLSAGGFHSLAIVGQGTPVISDITPFLTDNANWVITLPGFDYDGDSVSYIITEPPPSSSGVLYQYNNGVPGDAILNGNTKVSDSLGRVIFVPSSNYWAADNCPIRFAATDGVVASASRTVTIRIKTACPITAAPTQITPTNAVLNGVVSPNGFLTTAWFEWGTDLRYTNRTAPLTLGNGFAPITLTNTITGDFGVHPRHCRLVASNSVGVVRGADVQIAYAKTVVVWGNTTPAITNIPQSLTNVVAIDCGFAHGIGLKNTGVPIAWGTNVMGQTNIPRDLTNVVAVATGYSHSLLLKSDGAAVVVGGDWYATNVPPGLSNLVAVAAGRSQSLVLKNNGTVVAWGRNDVGQTNVPAWLDNVVAIAGGGRHSLALRNDGTVVAWGWNYYGQTNVPDGLSNVVAIAAGWGNSLALRSDGTISVWGDNQYNQASVPTSLSNVLSIVAARSRASTLALNTEGAIACWGFKDYDQTNLPVGMGQAFQLALGDTYTMALVPETVPQVRSTNFVGICNSNLVITLPTTDCDRDTVSIRIIEPPPSYIGTFYQYDSGFKCGAITNSNTVLLDRSGRVIFVPAGNGWLTNTYTFQFIVNDGQMDSAPGRVTVSLLPQFAITMAPTEITGTNAVLNGVVRPNGFATKIWFEWGTNLNYENSTVVTNASGLVATNGAGKVLQITNFITGLSPNQAYHYRIVASNNLAVVYGADQQVICAKAVFAWGNSIRGQTNVPKGLSNVVAQSLGMYHSLALKNDGTVTAWGDNYYGQCSVPADLTNVTAVLAAGTCSLALKKDGTVAAWGKFYTGWAYTPVYLPSGLSNVVAVAFSDNCCLALKDNGLITAWNNSGVQSLPFLTGLSNVVAITSGLALRNDGIPVAWGDNQFGQTNVPADATNIVAIAVGWGQDLALRKDGTVFGWGNNSYGEASVPAGLSNVIAISAGFYQSMALKCDGALVVWGNTGLGQVVSPVGLNHVVAVAPGCSLFASAGLVGLGESAPVTTPMTALGQPSADVVITLNGCDYDRDPISYKIGVPPTAGTLYQYNGGVRGAPILTEDTKVSDPSGRVIFVPGPGWGVPYSTFQFAATDGTLDSTPSQFNINIANSPVLTTEIATDVAPTSALLNGSLMSDQLDATAWYEYTPSTYWTTSAVINVKSSLDKTGVPMLVTNLYPGTTYRFRLAATNNACSSVPWHGEEMTLTTPVPTASLIGLSIGAKGVFEIGFKSTPGFSLNVYSSTNLIDWTWVGASIETSSGNFQFNDPNATNYSKRFYQLRWP